MARTEAPQPNPTEAKVLEGTLSLNLESLKGEPGIQGKTGRKGKDGLLGEQGLPGIDGKDGINGINGRDGKDGEQGPIGPQGTRGEISLRQRAGYIGLAGLAGLVGLVGLRGNHNETNIPPATPPAAEALPFVFDNEETTTTTEPETTTTTEAETTTTTEAQNIDPIESIMETPYANPADLADNGSFQLMDSDNGVHEIDLSGAIGFTPDADLRLSDIEPNELDVIPADAADFQAYLNSERDGFGPLAGFTDGTNDYNQYKDHESGPQVPAYSWLVDTGLYIEMPGIGQLKGGDGRAVMVLILNRTDDVYRFETNSVINVAGFQGWGRIWNGEAKEVQETEERLTNHYRERLGDGVPETGFIGQCDQAENNCDSVTVVSVERIQWGNNEDGTPRFQFRLIRAETVSTPSR